MDSRPLSAICFHESSHAGVAFALGIEVTAISCIPDVDPDGGVRHGHCIVDSTSDLELLSVVLAGKIGECMHRALPLPDKDDRDDKDMAYARTLARRIAGRRMDQALQRASDRAERLLQAPRVWLGVSSLAWKLAVVKRMNGNEIRRVLAAATSHCRV